MSEPTSFKIMLILEYNSLADLTYQEGLRKMTYVKVVGQMIEAERQIILETVQRDLENARREIRSREGKKGRSPKYTLEQKQRVVELVKAGVSYRAVQEATGVHHSSVGRIWEYFQRTRVYK